MRIPFFSFINNILPRLGSIPPRHPLGEIGELLGEGPAHDDLAGKDGHIPDTAQPILDRDPAQLRVQELLDQPLNISYQIIFWILIRIWT